MYFSSPTSNITPALASVVMSRTDSRDSTCSGVFSSRSNTSAYAALAMSTSPAWPISQPLSRTNSSSSSVLISHNTTTTQSRRESTSSTASGSATWAPSPFRSCLETSCVYQASSYISDDDLLYVAPPTTLEVESVPSLQKPKQEMTTEEQIAMYREMQEKEQQQSEHKRVVRFASNNLLAAEKTRRSSSSNVKRRSNTVRKSLHQYNGPQ